MDRNGGNPTGLYTSLVVDSLDNIFISYLDQTNNTLRLATNGSGSWKLNSIATQSATNGERSNSVAVSADGQIYIAFIHTVTNQLAIVKGMAGTLAASKVELVSPF